MPSSAVSPVPQGLELQGVSPMYVICVVLFSLGLSFLQSTCLQKLSLPIVGSGTNFSKVYGGFLVK